MNVRCLSAALVLAVSAALSASGQEPAETPALPPPASLSYADGDVQVLNGGAVVDADIPAMLIDGDGVRTGNGRAEIVFDDGSLLHLAEGTAVDLLGETRLRLLSGRAILRASDSAVSYTVDTPAASVRLEPRGEYLLTVDGARRSLALGVAAGAAGIEQPGGTLAINAGELIRLDGPGATPVIDTYNSARLDAFEHWSLARYDGDTLSESSRQLPAELRVYGDTFDRYGHWESVAPYGLVWYPRAPVAWRPYYNGGWRHTRYGWTWHGRDPWAWPTHHYGRWHFSGAAWFWIPTRVWGPAWVSWAYAPGYVSWAPLGWDSRPVVPFYLRAGYANPHRWRAWTVVTRTNFGRHGLVSRWAVDGRRLPSRAGTSFVERRVTSTRPLVHAIRRDGAVRGVNQRAVPRRAVAGRVAPGTPVSGGRRRTAVPRAATRSAAPPRASRGAVRRPPSGSVAARPTGRSSRAAVTRGRAAGREGTARRAAPLRVTPSGRGVAGRTARPRVERARPTSVRPGASRGTASARPRRAPASRVTRPESTRARPAPPRVRTGAARAPRPDTGRRAAPPSPRSRAGSARAVPRGSSGPRVSRPAPRSKGGAASGGQQRRGGAVRRPPPQH